ncbi:MAG: trbC/VIRB2 family protein [Caballeronia mineralivorans]|jgi:type IV secretion system protein VirB2|nr:trbC/VIRB2 family protein [Caballeronia mineralivorans]
MKSVILNSISMREMVRKWCSLAAPATRLMAGCLPMLVMASPAYAQLSQVNTLLTTIQTTLLGVGGVVCSISIIWAGFKMMFQHARFGDIANVFIGGLFVGCATVIAAMLISTT